MVTDVRVVLQLALGLVFMISAVGKALAPASFAQGVAEYEVLPRPLAYSIALIIIIVESLLSIAHLTGLLLWLAVPLGLAAFATFASAVGLNLARGRRLPCYCFGGRSAETITGYTLARLLLLLSCEAFLLNTKGGLGNRLSHSSLQGYSLALILAALLVLTGIWAISLPDLFQLVKRRDPCVLHGVSEKSPESLSHSEP